MPLADFLATAGRGTAIGNVAEAFGGRTPLGQQVESFNQNEVPKLLDAMKKAQTVKEMLGVRMQAMDAWSRAGLPPEGFGKFQDAFIGPAIEGARQDELDSIRRDYGPQTTPLTPQVAPQGQGQPLGLDTAFAPQTTPARNPLADPEGAFRVAQALGANPAGYKQLLETQSEIENRQAEAKQHAASAAQTEQSVREQQKVSDVQLPGSAGEAGLTAGAFMTPHAGPLATYMTGLNPQREPSGAALDLKRQGLEIQQQRLQVLADRVSSGQATAADRAELAQARLQLERDKLEQAKTTSTEAPVSGIQSAMDERVIARKAADRGTTDPASLKKIAAELGYELEGTPTLNVPTEQKSKVLGFEVPGTVQRDKEGKPIIAPPTLTGDFTLKRKPKTVTRGVPGGQAPQAQPGEGGTVLMRAPDGSQRQVPANRVDEFKRKGATVVGGR